MDDREFVQSCAKGDKAAWDKFAEKYSRLVYYYIKATLRLKGKANLPPETSDEIFQDIFVLLSKDNFKKLLSYRGRNNCSLASWLRQVVVNYTLDQIHKARGSVLSLDQEDEEGHSLAELIPDTAPGAGSVFFAKDRLFHLEECIEGLGLEDKFFLEMHIYHQVKLEELKDLLKLTRGAIDMRKARIIERLRDCFKSKGFALDLA